MKLGDSNFSLVTLGEDKYLCRLKDKTFNINNVLYPDLTIIFRLLTFDELKVVDKLLPDEKDKPDFSSSIKLELEEDIFRKCVYQIFGVSDIKDIDLDTLEAGLISTVSGLILRRSYDHVQDFSGWLNKYIGSAQIYDQIKLYVSRYFNMTYKEVQELPIDILLKKYAVFHATFPNEALKLDGQQESHSDDE